MPVGCADVEPPGRGACLSDLSASSWGRRIAGRAGPDRAVCANRFRYNAGEPPPAAGLPFGMRRQPVPGGTLLRHFAAFCRHAAADTSSIA